MPPCQARPRPREIRWWMNGRSDRRNRAPGRTNSKGRGPRPSRVTSTVNPMGTKAHYNSSAPLAKGVFAEGRRSHPVARIRRLASKVSGFGAGPEPEDGRLPVGRGFSEVVPPSGVERRDLQALEINSLKRLRTVMAPASSSSSAVSLLEAPAPCCPSGQTSPSRPGSRRCRANHQRVGRSCPAT